ncbi:D-arabinose 1-dehydrogenase (NAD(P)(+)) ARA1 [Cyberlindnera jadinii NRRL Y-1542]|uniref:Aldo/keto reductase n=1 Tax=Cyberlindnera jadinii (strain ATCC 18201 / CBS 1600 / BCRC 20928 / JCM 3617 / NBRC 0987 / NRRL Y-1542) TaxID=983966 RepID=A0A1E4S0L7_CYBJN|nr:Aldo/keto reductase [Cyberlindnera jadinii NRRL Y-1542]ODV73033.1 Aldo/keto reductase [Cyberlindnera jadinii NRRL Y-1542]
MSIDTVKLTVKLNDGSVMPALTIGTPWTEEEFEKLPGVLQAAIDNGFRSIDTAWYYGSEPTIGKFLKDLFAKGAVKREDLFITTKVWPSLWDRAELSINKSLQDLGLDYVDLALQHWPVCYKGTDSNGLPKNPRDSNGVLQFDENGDFVTTYKQLLELKARGLVKSVGVSNFTQAHLKRAVDETGVVPSVLQLELHPKIPSLELVKYAESLGVKVAAFSPLGSTGAPLLKEPVVLELSTKYSAQPANVVYAYHLLRGRIVVTRTSNPKRIPTLKTIPSLSEEDIGKLDEIGLKDPKRFIQDDWGVGLGFPHWKDKYSWEE